MNTKVRGWAKWGKYLGLAASLALALALPAVVVAQQSLLPNPNPFVQGQPLTAGSLSGMRDAVNLLIGSVNSLQSQRPSWGAFEAPTTITTNTTTSIRIPGAGFLMANPTGTGFGTIDIAIRVGGEIRSRGVNGSGATLAVTGTDQVTVETADINGNSVVVVFRPLLFGN